jgi:hypothetical protein
MPGLDDFVSEHERRVGELRHLHARIRDEVIPRIAAISTELLSSPLLIPVRPVLRRNLELVLQGINECQYRIGVLLLSATLPVRVWQDATQWTVVRAEVSSVGGDLDVTNRQVHAVWRGLASDAYHRIIPSHVTAAARLSSVADQTQFALTWCAAAGAAFYAMLLALVLEFYAALLVALAAAAPSGGLGTTVALLMITGGFLSRIGVLITAGVQTSGQLRTWWNELLSEMRDNVAFPNGRWPHSRTEWYIDATVTDGDADWSLRA